MVWPVLLLYPEYGTSDFVETFREMDSFRDHLEVRAHVKLLPVSCLCCSVCVCG